ncbi:MAG: hypothetical protein VR78_15395 [Hoeflea sp. BRH_c9]|nr:MAG: hypothetical protein VR78_15395 [Hoeflea sp. BRH_c9]
MPAAASAASSDAGLTRSRTEPAASNAAADELTPEVGHPTSGVFHCGARRNRGPPPRFPHHDSILPRVPRR